MYYTYAYLREDGTPYYIGKGSGRRAWAKHGIGMPSEDRILMLKVNLTEEEAFRHEKYLISVLGRKDAGTGILRNMTDGGEGISGYQHTAEYKEWVREWATGRKQSSETIAKRVAKNTGKRRTPQQADNCGAPKRQTFTAVDPNGNEHTFTGLNKFCRDNNLSPSNFCRVLRGHRAHHKGWTAKS